MRIVFEQCGEKIHYDGHNFILYEGLNPVRFYTLGSTIVYILFSKFLEGENKQNRDKLHFC